MNSNQQREKDEYSVFLKHLEEEKQETSNFAKIMLVIISILCGIVIGFLLLSDSDFLNEMTIKYISKRMKIIKLKNHGLQISFQNFLLKREKNNNLQCRCLQEDKQSY